MMKQNRPIVKDTLRRNLIQEAQWKFGSLKSQFCAMSVKKRAIYCTVAVFLGVLVYLLCTDTEVNLESARHKVFLVRSVMSEDSSDGNF